MTTPTITRKLTRSRHDRMIGGVCGGLAKRYGWNPGKVRLAFVASCLLPGPQVLAYLGLWLIIPKEDR